MKSTIFLPDKINVGFQERSGTYTGQLAYVIYFDNKNKLRKETSWNSWRNKEIDNQILDNVPTDGFVLNKKVGGYSSGWNHRNTYVRIYDPRGFEFEITVPNLLYILENTNSIIGKGLEGEFIYGWEGGDLILIPCKSTDYKAISQFNKMSKQSKSYKGKDMIIGGTYRNKKDKEIIYVGRFDYYAHSYSNDIIKKNKRYYFYEPITQEFDYETTLTGYVIDTISEGCNEYYAEIFEKLEYCEYYNPYDKSKDEYINHTLESFRKYTLNGIIKQNDFFQDNEGCETASISYYCENGKKVRDYGCRWHELTTQPRLLYMQETEKFQWYENTRNDNHVDNYLYNYDCIKSQLTIEEVFNRVNPQYKKEYLLDGKIKVVRCYE